MHIKENPSGFHRFGALWTPSVLILDSDGKERQRIEGYLPKKEFRAQLELALARLAFVDKRFTEAEKAYGNVARQYPNSAAAPEALYWEAVSHYKGTKDHTSLEAVVEKLKKYPHSIWAEKAIPWAH